MQSVFGHWAADDECRQFMNNIRKEIHHGTQPSFQTASESNRMLIKDKGIFLIFVQSLSNLDVILLLHAYTSRGQFLHTSHL
jgi:hypothetical protein